MRINWLISLGRFQGYIGHRGHWDPEWRAERVTCGHALMLGHWRFIACWLPPRKPDAELDAELLGLTPERLLALEAADAANPEAAP
jgi:hypothetical protein